MATDQELLQAYLAQRDEGSFAELWRRHQAMVTAVARRIVGHPADAEDVTQEVFSELSRCAHEIACPAAWLHRAATFRAIDRLRSHSGLQRALTHQTEPTYVMRTPDWGVDAQVDQAMETLDELDRRLIVLHFMEGRSQQEVALEVGLDQANVSRRVTAARDRLRRLLASMGLGSGAVPGFAWLQAVPGAPELGVSLAKRKSTTHASASAVSKPVVITGIGVGLSVLGLIVATNGHASAPQPAEVAEVAQRTEVAPLAPASTPAVVKASPTTQRRVQTGDQLLPDDLRGIAELADGSLVVGHLQRDPGQGLMRCRDGVVLSAVNLPDAYCGNHGLCASGENLWGIIAVRSGGTWPNLVWQRELWQLLPVQKRVTVLDQMIGTSATPAGGLSVMGTTLFATVDDQLVACNHDGELWRVACPGGREVAHDRVRHADGSLSRIIATGELVSVPGNYDFIAPDANGGLLVARGTKLQALSADGTVLQELATAEKGITGLLRQSGDWVVAANGVGTAHVGTVGAVLTVPGRWALRSLGTMDAAAHTADGRVLSTAQQWRADGTFQRWTIDGIAHPDDPRLHGVGSSAWHAVVDGHELLLTGHDFGNCALFRFDAAGVAVPVATWMTSASDARPLSGQATWPSAFMGTGSWSWFDANGDGRLESGECRAESLRGYPGSCWLDDQGGVWRNVRQANGILYSAIERMLPDGRPIYAPVRRFAVPAPLLTVERLAYDAAADALYASGFTTDRPAQGDDGRWAGSELVRIDGWLRGEQRVRWRADIPYAPSRAETANGFTIAPGAVFIGAQRISDIIVLQADTGRAWGRLPVSDARPSVAGSEGWNWGGLHARQLAPQSYQVTASDRRGWVSWQWSSPD